MDGWKPQRGLTMVAGHFNGWGKVKSEKWKVKSEK